MSLALGIKPEFYDDLEGTLDEAWRLLEAGVSDRLNPFHQCALATVDRDGAPSARSVVIREVDQARRRLRFHTDARAEKVREMEAQPVVALHFYDPDFMLQIRLRGRAMLHTDDAFATAAWSGMLKMRKVFYGQSVAPGTPVEHAFLVDTASPLPEAASRRNFIAVEVRIEALEWLYLAATGHRRAIFDLRTEPATGRWLAP